MVFSSSRITAAALAVTTTALAIGLSLSSAPAADAATPPAQTGLFGSQDPTYDGVFRQSLSLLAFTAADRTPPAEAVAWLLAQQCGDGGFQSFRPDTSRACTRSDPAAFAGEDTNSTGIAATALRAIGRTAAADRALAWLDKAQNTDGGFPYFLGGDSDANSTSVVLLGTNAAGRAPTSVQRGGVSAATYLESVQVGCAGAATDDDGGFAFQDYGTGLVDNDAATVQATLALSGVALPLSSRKVGTAVPRATCPAASASTGARSPSAELGAGHIARLLDTFGGAVPLFDYTTGARVPGSVSIGDTAWAVLSLAAVGVGRTQLDAALAVLTARTTSAPTSTTRLSGTHSTAARVSAKAVAADQPGLLSLAALATAAAGGSSASLDRLVTRIGATVRTAPVAGSPSPTPSTSTSTSTPAPSGSAASTGNASLPPTGTTPLTPVLAILGAALLLMGGLAVGTTRRGAHA